MKPYDFLSSVRSQKQNSVIDRMSRLTAKDAIKINGDWSCQSLTFCQTSPVVFHDRSFIFGCAVPLRTQCFHPIFSSVNNTLIPVLLEVFSSVQSADALDLQEN